MKLESLRYFHVTQACGSIRKAAERLHVAPSAISRQIAILERELGLRLLERSSSGVCTTAAGALLGRSIQSIFRDIERARSAIDDLKGLRIGEVTIYAMEGLVSDFLPTLFVAFHKKFPGIGFNLVLAPTDRIIEAVLRDEADIGITFNAKPKQELSVVARYAEPVSCLVAPHHPLAREKAVSLRQLRNHAVALPKDAFGLRQLIDDAARRAGVALKVMMTTNSLELTKKLAESGVAVAFMPAFTVSAEVARGSLRCIPVSDKAFRVAYSEVCVHRNRAISAAAQEFLDALVRALRALPSSSAA
ncbi:MAG TPA: LysR family transcriptional regulator [Alphaproteobacteria bacterium]|nr:LysR family transcriptional regulator [Alphaproteobacteria bacterium]